MDYKETLNLPSTDFPMKANLPEREPLTLKKWERMGIYRKITEKHRGKEKFVLHDGPPYANGHIHMGHALNKILKDIIVKYMNLKGKWSEYVPGWDCHGLPIEHQVDKNLGDKKDSVPREEKRSICRKYAEKFIDIQREEFKRLGVFGDWENPYLTMSYDYEARTLRELGSFVSQGAVYRGVKPVYWCKECKTALAEAEVEYHDHASPSIYVRFPLIGDPARISEKLSGENISFVIWTTTPWTIPSNLAVALHPELDYVALKWIEKDEVFIIAKGLLEDFTAKTGIEKFEVIDTFRAEHMEKLETSHPLYDRVSIIVLADYVTLEAGTGCVHTAPGHGREDYETGLKYGLDIYAPLDDAGRFTSDVGFFGGQDVFDANAPVVEKLREVGNLISDKVLSHSYPHCWRCKEPVIFRATSQWFISMDLTGLRGKALDEISKVEWIPHWGQNRIESMIETRPDWCISRQRAWGVPITALKCKSCGMVTLDEKIIEKAAKIFEKEGADGWFKRPVDEITGGFGCPDCGGRDFEKEMDILDVWFDSGISYAAVCENRDNLGVPVELYLEGSDQHRGWFHSSLLAATGTRGYAPYRAVLTHGFVVDGNGKKMSKSLGNYVAPEEIINKFGAEILRLWVIAEDYRDDIRISGEILARVSEAYRKIRNTIRFLIANLYDFEPDRDTLEPGMMLPIDRYALIVLNRLIEKVEKAYEKYEFHQIFHSVHNFCVVDMSNFYLDTIKDRLYASSAGSEARKSAQTAMFHILKSVILLMAPVISFTSEEAWNYAPKWSGKGESPFLEELPQALDIPEEDSIEERFETLKSIREEVTKALEEERVKKTIGHSLDADVTLEAWGDGARFISDNLEILRDILIVSNVSVVEGEGKPGLKDDGEKMIGISISRSDNKKCERCWKLEESVGNFTDHPTLCERCREVIT